MARTESQLVEMNGRRRELALLLLRGYRDRSMLADHFHVSRRTIAKDINALDRRWVTEQLDLTDRRKARLLSELQLLKREAWKAWEESKKPEADETVTEPAPGGGERQVRRYRGGPRAGDVSFLARVESCIEKECMILGIRPPPGSVLAQAAEADRMQISIASLSADAVGILCDAILAHSTASEPSGIQRELEGRFLERETQVVELPEDAGELPPEERAAAQEELGIEPLPPSANGSNGEDH